MAITHAVIPIRPASAGEGDTYTNYPLANGADFKIGTFVVLATGAINKVANSETAKAAGVLGIATADATSYSWMDSTRNDVVPQVPVALPDQVFRGTLKGTFAAADVGAAVGIDEDASGYWVIDRTDTTHPVVRVLSVDDGVAVGDINVPCTFMILPTARQVTL